MTESQKVGLVLPWRHYRSLDRAVRREFGESIGQIAEHDPLGAFDALSFGMKALYTRRGRTELVQQTVDSNDTTTNTGVVNRELDGEQAYSGAVGHATSGLVGGLVERYLEGAEDFAIQVNKDPSYIGKLLGRQPVQEIVAVIPRQA